MIWFTIGNILEADSEAIVNTVNTHGVMGKGIALAFKESFPQNYKDYRKAYEAGELEVGKMLIHKTGLISPRLIINFPTKKHWKFKSKVEYIEKGLNDLLRVIREEEIRSIAIPPLGCGNGGLNWNEVKELIVNRLRPIEDFVEITIYEPGFSLEIKPVKSINELNPVRAIYLHVIRQYESLGEEITTLVVQKLAYLVQRSGENLRLHFEKGPYGPYSSNLNKMLQAFSPNFLHYEGDLSKPHTRIVLNQEKKYEIQKFLDAHLDSSQKARLEFVEKLIEGFENSFGLELLATVAFAMEKCPACSKDEIVGEIQNWTYRKKELMSPHLISVSFDRLKEFGL